MINKIYAEHIQNIPNLVTPLTNDYKNDVMRMLDKQDLIKYIIDKGTNVFNKEYAERLSHLVLLDKLIIPNSNIWINNDKTNDLVKIDCISILKDGFYYKTSIQKKSIQRCLSEIHQALFYYIKRNNYINIELVNLIEVFALYYRLLIKSDSFFSLVTSNVQAKEVFMKQVISNFIESLIVGISERNGIKIIISDRSFNELKELNCILPKDYTLKNDYDKMIIRFLDCFNGRVNDRSVLGILPRVELSIHNNYGKVNYLSIFDTYRGCKYIDVIDKYTEEDNISLIILDMNRLLEYNAVRDKRACLKDLYIDAQGLNQIKRSTLSSDYDNKNLTVRVINVKSEDKDLVLSVLNEETERLKSAYRDNFNYEICYK